MNLGRAEHEVPRCVNVFLFMFLAARCLGSGECACAAEMENSLVERWMSFVSAYRGGLFSSPGCRSGNGS